MRSIPSQHTSAYVSICQHTSRDTCTWRWVGDFSIRQHTSAYVSIRKHTCLLLNSLRTRLLIFEALFSVDYDIRILIHAKPAGVVPSAGSVCKECSDNSKVFRLMNTCRLMVEDFLAYRSRIPPVSLRLSLMRFYYLTQESIQPDTKILIKRLTTLLNTWTCAVLLLSSVVARDSP